MSGKMKLKNFNYFLTGVAQNGAVGHIARDSACPLRKQLLLSMIKRRQLIYYLF